MARESSLGKLYDLAEGQDGYFSRAQAVEAGVHPMALQKALNAGHLRRTSRGVYRLTRFPEVSEYSHLWGAVLWPQVRTRVTATLSHDTALQLHGLSTVNPDKIHITVPKELRIKRDSPKGLVVHKFDLSQHEVVYVDGLPTTSIERTLRDIAATGNRVILHDALRDARARNLPVPPELADA